MTMQTTSLPIQVSSVGAQVQPQHNAAAGVQAPATDDGKFGATLSREIAQRQVALQPSSTAPANKSAATKQSAVENPAAKGAKGMAPDPAKQNETASKTALQSSSDTVAAVNVDETAEGAAWAGDDAATQAATPITDLLLFMAGLTQPASTVPVMAVSVVSGTPDAGDSTFPVVAASVAGTVDTSANAANAGAAGMQLAALQSAFNRLGSPDDAATTATIATIATTTTTTTTATTAPAAASTGTTGEAAAGETFAAGIQIQSGKPDIADLRMSQQQVQTTIPTGVAENMRKPEFLAADAGTRSAATVEPPLPSVAQLQTQVTKLDALAVPVVPGDRIPARLGTQAWDNQVSQRIVYMIGKEQAATLTLNPPDLGPVQVVLNVSNDQASVTFSSNQLEVRQALENALPRLREMMGESGIALGNASVDAGTAGQQQGSQDSAPRHRSGFGNVAGTTKAGDDGTGLPAAHIVTRGDIGKVDTFA